MVSVSLRPLMAAGVNTREMSKHSAVMRAEAGGQTCPPPNTGGWGGDKRPVRISQNGDVDVGGGG